MDAIFHLSPDELKNTTLVIFCLSYLGIAVGRVYGLALDRTGIILLGSIAMLAVGSLALEQAVNAISAPSIVLLFALMVIASQLKLAGFYHKIASSIAKTLAITSGVLSNLINNSAAVMLLVDVADLKNPINGYALALSNSFAGNLLLIGSMANIVVVQYAADFGIKIGFGTFAKYGIPTALASFAILLTWLHIMQ